LPQTPQHSAFELDRYPAGKPPFAYCWNGPVQTGSLVLVSSNLDLGFVAKPVLRANFARQFSRKPWQPGHHGFWGARILWGAINKWTNSGSQKRLRNSRG